jgi:hypothetical protein
VATHRGHAQAGGAGHAAARKTGGERPGVLLDVCDPLLRSAALAKGFIFYFSSLLCSACKCREVLVYFRI